jgi:septal ring factor EnvC (AmiA/AmiB activator)
MMKCEFEKLIGRQVPVEVYMEIESEYMASNKEKAEFTAEWTAERIDSLICKKFFEMNMMVLESESKVSGYQNRIQELNTNLGSKQTRLWQEEKENSELYGRISALEEEVKELKARLYDKQNKKSA